MKEIAFTLLAITFLSVGYMHPVFAQTTYTDTPDHYTFDLPARWEEIPRSVIDQYIDALVQQTQGQRVEYSSGFQLSEKEYFQYPYVLVQEHRLNTPSYSEVENIFGSDFQDFAEENLSEYSELISNASIDKPFLDRQRNILFMNIEANVTNVGQIKGLSAIFLGKESMTQLNFYSLLGEYSQWLPVFNTMISSFKYESAYVYDPAEAVKNDSPSIFEGALEKGLAGAIMGGLIGLVFFLFRRKKKNEEPKP